MDQETIQLFLLAIVAASLLITMVLLLRRRGRLAAGFCFLLSANLGLALYALSVPEAHQALTFGALAAFAVLVLVPGGIGILVRRALSRGRLDRAATLVQMRQMFQPWSGLERDLELLRGLALVHDGRMDEAIALRREQLKDEELDPRLRLTVVEQLLTFLLHGRQWDEVVALFEAEGGQGLATVSTPAAAAATRALLELDRFQEAAGLQGVMEYGKAGSNVSHALLLNQSRLVFLAHLGRVQQLDPLMDPASGFLPGLSPGQRTLWRAVALERAGQGEAAREALVGLVGTRGDPQLVQAVTSRLDQPPLPLPPDVPDAEMEALCEHISAAGATYRSMPSFKGRVWQLAPVTTALMGIIVLVHLAVELAGGSQDGWTLTRFGANFAVATKGAEPWRLVTSMFLHAGHLHLLVNLYTLFILGRFVEQLYGSRRFWVLYLVAGVVGSAASAYLGGDQRLSVGASGAIFGLLGGALVGMIRLRGHVPEAWRKQVATNLLIVIALNFYIGYTIPRVDNSAHLGGLAGGVLVGLILIRARAGLGAGTVGASLGRRVLTPLALLLVAVTLLCGVMAGLTTPRGLMDRLPRVEASQGGLSVTVPGHWINLPEQDVLMLQDPLLDITPTLQFEVVGLAPGVDLLAHAQARTAVIAGQLAAIKEVQRAQVHGQAETQGEHGVRTVLRVEAQGRFFLQVHLFRRSGELVLTAIVRLPSAQVEAYQGVMAQIQRSMAYGKSSKM